MHEVEVYIASMGSTITFVSVSDDKLAEMLKNPEYKVKSIDKPKRTFYPYRRRKGKQ